MATVKEMMQDIGKRGSFYAGGLRIEVEIIDVKISFGSQRWQVKPVAGDGEVWVESVEILEV